MSKSLSQKSFESLATLALSTGTLFNSAPVKADTTYSEVISGAREKIVQECNGHKDTKTITIRENNPYINGAISRIDIDCGEESGRYINKYIQPGDSTLYAAEIILPTMEICKYAPGKVVTRGFATKAKANRTGSFVINCKK